MGAQWAAATCIDSVAASAIGRTGFENHPMDVHGRSSERNAKSPSF